ncbi:MAG: phosphoglycerate dehydrogenase [Planctomycetota bacterium]
MKRFSILCADDLGAEGLALLREVGDVTVSTGMDETRLRAALAGHDALVVRSATKVTARALEGGDRLALIGRAGIGVDNIDLDAATARGIVVMNTPDAGAVTTAELAIALLVSLARHVPAADQNLKSGQWEKKRFVGVELTGKTLGVVGLGNIGRIVADRGAGLAMEVIAYDPFVPQERAPSGVRMVDLDELCARADFVTIHVPLMDSTRHLFDAARLASLRKGARLIHAARGGIVDDVALLEALRSGHLAGAALDVFEIEPLPVDHPFRSLPNVVLTPHIGASTHEAQRNVAVDLARQVVMALRRGIVLNGVNVPRISPSQASVLAPFLDLGHRLAAFLCGMHEGRIESLRVTLQGALTENAARPLTVAVLCGALRRAVDRPVTPVNAERIAADLGIRVHSETSTLKRDFLHLIRVEALIDGARHHVTGTVLGQRHPRLVEYDGLALDAIPEPPLLVTRHDDRPGVLGAIATLLGSLDRNIERMELGGGKDAQAPALGIFNLDRPLDEADLARVRDLPVVRTAVQIV